MIPSKHVIVPSEEGDERTFQFSRKGGVNGDGMVSIVSQWHRLGQLVVFRDCLSFPRVLSRGSWRVLIPGSPKLARMSSFSWTTAAAIWYNYSTQ